MEQVARAPLRPGGSRLRFLNRPVPVRVFVRDGLPAAVARRGGPPVGVAAVLDRWELADRLWADAPIRRKYLRLLLVNGRRLTVFYDEAAGRWFEQGGWG